MNQNLCMSNIFNICGLIAGKVTVVSKLDYESERSYVLTVSASDRSDHPLSSECTLRVDVLDVNDNPPEFPSSHYEVIKVETMR